MFKKTLWLTTIILMMANMTIAYEYSATKGNRQVWADDLEAHGTRVNLPFKVCNLAGSTKTLKPTSFLDMTGTKAYYWANVTSYGWKYNYTLVNVTKWHVVGLTNTSYQETIPKLDGTWTAYTHLDWKEIATTKSKGKKKEETTSSISFTGGECKEFKFTYENTIQPIGEPAIKYDLGENKEEILDPIINATDYQFNATQDSNSSLTTATINSDVNVTIGGNTTYANTSDLVAQWALDDQVGSATAKDDVGLRPLTVINAINWSFGKPGKIGTAGKPNDTGAFSINGVSPASNGFLCLVSGTPFNNLTTVDFYISVHTINIAGNDPNASPMMSTSGIILDINRTRYLKAVASGAAEGSLRSVWSSTPLTLNTNYQIAYTYNGTKLRLFINGIDSSAYNNTSPFTYDNGTNSIIAIGADSSSCNNPRPCRDYDASKGTEGNCLNATYDQIRWRNITTTSFGLVGGRYVSNYVSSTNNVTRFRAQISSSNNALANVSVTFNGGSNYLENVTNNTVTNWTQNTRNSLRLTVDAAETIDFYWANLTLATPTFNESILTSKNITHNNTLNITIQCSDGLPNPTFYYYDNTSLFNINTNTGSINYDPSQSQTSSYQIGVTCDENSYNITRPYNLTVFDSAMNVTSVEIGPPNPQPGNTLNCNIYGKDNENDPLNESLTDYTWYINNIPSATKTKTLSTGFGPGDTAICQAIANEGLLNTTAQNSSAVNISVQSGGGGGGESNPLNPPEEELEEEIQPLNQSNPQALLEPLVITKEIIKEVIKIPSFCGNNICDGNETPNICRQDCKINADTYIKGSYRAAKCWLGIGPCDENAIYFGSSKFMIAIFYIGLLIILAVIILAITRELEKQKHTKKKRLRYAAAG